MIKIERLCFRHIWSMMTRSKHECWHLRTNKCIRTNICKTSVFVVSVRNINICGRILTQFTGLLRTNVTFWQNVQALENQFQYRSVRTGLRKFHSVKPFNSNFCELGQAGSLRKRWNFHLRLSAKRLLFYFSAKFGPFSNPFGGRASAVHDERAE